MNENAMNDVENKADKQEVKKTNTFWPITIAILICVTLLVLAPFIAKWYAFFFLRKDISSLADSGIFGDSFGFANALISAGAFAGVIVSMYLQRKDLELQRKSLEVQQKELKQNTQELALQREEFKEQNKTLKLQRFENTFFNMLSLQQEITNNIKYSYNETDYTPYQLEELNMTENKRIFISGREVFEHLYNLELIPTIKEEGLSGFITMQSLNLFDHYFLHVYRIMKFVDETNLLDDETEKYSYISTLRATLSRYELIFLFYNELSFPSFKKLIEEYSLFDNINKRSLIASEKECIDVQLNMYDMSAFDPLIKRYNK